MEITRKIKKSCQKMFKKIKLFAFQVQPNVLEHQNNEYDFFDEIVLRPQRAVPLFTSELSIGIQYNIFTSLTCFIYIPIKFQQCMECDQCLTYWLIILGLSNFIGLFPKILAYQKLIKYRNNEDNRELSRILWLYVRSNIHKFNEIISKFVFSIHIIGALRVWQLQQYQCHSNYIIQIAYTLVLTFFSRLILSFIRFNSHFSSHIIEQENGLDDDDLNQLEISVLQNDFLEKYRQQDTCSICFDNFHQGQQIRQMNCLGNHIYHLKCIDVWLATKKTCPNCNQLAVPKSY